MKYTYKLDEEKVKNKILQEKYRQNVKIKQNRDGEFQRAQVPFPLKSFPLKDYHGLCSGGS